MERLIKQGTEDGPLGHEGYRYPTASKKPDSSVIYLQRESLEMSSSSGMIPHQCLLLQPAVILSKKIQLSQAWTSGPQKL